MDDIATVGARVAIRAAADQYRWRVGNEAGLVMLLHRAGTTRMVRVTFRPNGTISDVEGPQGLQRNAASVIQYMSMNPGPS